MVDNYSSVKVEPRGQRSDSLFAHFCQHSLVSSDWDVTSMKIFQQLLEGGVSDSETVDTAGWVWSGVDSSFVNYVCVCVGVKRWEYERTRERCRTAAYWTVMNSYDWQSMSNPLKSHCLQNRAHALSNIQHPMMFLIACHLEGAWNLKTLMRKIQLCITYTGIIVFKNVEALYLPPQKLLLNWFLLACLDLFLTRWWEPP